MTAEPAEAQVISDLISDVFCECRRTVQADVGRLSAELFLKVDVEGRSLQSAADAVGLSTADARTVLFIFRRRMAGSLVESILASRLTESAQTREEGRQDGDL